MAIISLDFFYITLMEHIKKSISGFKSLYKSIDDTAFCFHYKQKPKMGFNKAQSVVVPMCDLGEESPCKKDNCPYDPQIVAYLKTFSKFLQMIWFNEENVTKEIELKKPEYSSIKPEKKVVIFDMDETLFHYESETDTPHLRPYCKEALAKLLDKYELWLWTASEKDYAEVVINNFIDPEHIYFKHILTRNACIGVSSNIFIKDLRIFSNLKRENVIIVENSLISFSTCISNGYLCDTYTDNKDDEELLRISSFLCEISSEHDLRDPLKKIFQFEDCVNYIFKK